MNDAPFQKIVTAWMASEAYRRLRSDGAQRSTTVRQFSCAAATAADRRARPDGDATSPACRSSRSRPLQAPSATRSTSTTTTSNGSPSTPAHRLRPGMFVAQVVGKSMEPAIPDGAYCLFARACRGHSPRQDRPRPTSRRHRPRDRSALHRQALREREAQGAATPGAIHESR